ncbi:DUF4003 family protein [Virgibacillus senegalensis]|uniref:DUF4003 family protein n=1 Tax=Virgibacillus senegalensis TaxID=1499679 RepID=UPI00069CC2ED|nr:DUF4003 family protein [Virgibacillus senegalensis]
MYTKDLQQKTAANLHIFDELKAKLKWKVSDQQVLMMAASIYVVNGKTFDYKRFIQLADYIKQESGIFSSLKSQSRFTVAAMLDVRYTDSREKFQEMRRVYKQLVEAGFRRGIFTYISAMVLLSHGKESGDFSEEILKADAIFQKMKDEHSFLTSSSDYPLAALLAQKEGIVTELIDRTETYYQRLNQQGFRKGNDLQFMSHILTLDDNEEAEADLLVERAAWVHQAFGQAGMKQKTKFYPEMGMLALLPEELVDLGVIKQIIDELSEHRSFRWQKDITTILAVNLFMSDKLADASLLETSLYTTMETVIQAQQAAMLAAIAGASVATSSSSS